MTLLELDKAIANLRAMAARFAFLDWSHNLRGSFTDCGEFHITEGAD